MKLQSSARSQLTHTQPLDALAHMVMGSSADRVCIMKYDVCRSAKAATARMSAPVDSSQAHPHARAHLGILALAARAKLRRDLRAGLAQLRRLLIVGLELANFALHLLRQNFVCKCNNIAESHSHLCGHFRGAHRDQLVCRYVAHLKSGAR